MTSRKLIISSGGRGRSCTYGVSNVTDLQSAALATRLTHPYGWTGGIRIPECQSQSLMPSSRLATVQSKKKTNMFNTIYDLHLPEDLFPNRPFRATDMMLIHVCM